MTIQTRTGTPSGRLGRLIVFEGPDGAGKTTLISRYADYAREVEGSVTTLSFPGREPGSLGSHIYALHHEPGQFGIVGMTAESLQALHVAAHLDAIDRFIRPRIEQGEMVLLDRYWWSTWVYGIDAGAREETLNALAECERGHWGSLTPSAIILVTRRDSLRAEDAGEAWSRRMRLYQTVAEREQSRYPVRIIHNDTSEADALVRIARAVEEVSSNDLRDHDTMLVKPLERQP